MVSDKWEIGLTSDADHGLAELPKQEAKKAQKIFEEMESQPYAAASKLKYTQPYSVWRRKKGRLRVIFQVDKSRHKVRILRVDLRDENTYSDFAEADTAFAD